MKEHLERGSAGTEAWWAAYDTAVSSRVKEIISAVELFNQMEEGSAMTYNDIIALLRDVGLNEAQIMYVSNQTDLLDKWKTEDSDESTDKLKLGVYLLTGDLIDCVAIVLSTDGIDSPSEASYSVSGMLVEGDSADMYASSPQTWVGDGRYSHARKKEDSSMSLGKFIKPLDEIDEPHLVAAIAEWKDWNFWMKSK